MFKDSVEQDMIARVTEADYHLMRELAASHGLAFAAAFRIEHANAVARAMQVVAGTKGARRRAIATRESVGHHQAPCRLWPLLLAKWRQAFFPLSRHF